jgi:hypothetical protein
LSWRKKRAKAIAAAPNIRRNVERICEAFEELGLRLYNPEGEKYSESRTDCEASIAGNAAKDLYITDVLKPAILQINNNHPTLIQKAVVIADNK